MNKKELEQRFLDKQVVIDGLNPGKDSGNFHFEGIFKQVWELEEYNTLGFSACSHTWPSIDYWREVDGDLYGFYDAAAYPKSEPGFVRIRSTI